MLAYLSRYTHRVAIANSRLIALDDKEITFTWKDYRAKDGDLHKTMALPIPEFIRRFLLHVLPQGFHRIRHYGLFANGGRAENLARARELLQAPPPQDEAEPVTAADDKADTLSTPCPRCGGPMVVIETFEPGPATRQGREPMTLTTSKSANHACPRRRPRRRLAQEHPEPRIGEQVPPASASRRQNSTPPASSPAKVSPSNGIPQRATASLPSSNPHRPNAPRHRA